MAPELIINSVAVVVCGHAANADDATMLLDMLGIIEQEPGTYARSDEELIAAGEVCGRGHPQNRENLAARAGRTKRCKQCDAERYH